MNEGFFSSTETRAVVPLPPRLNGTFPPTVPPKPKSNVHLLRRDQVIMDIECYVNFFLIKFMRLHDNKIFGFDRREGKKLDYKGVQSVLDRYEIITFNGNSYDIPILELAMTGAENHELKYATNQLIVGKLPVWKFRQQYDLTEMKIRHIDVNELLPGFVSLKIHGGRLGCRKLQDLPYPEDSVLTAPQMDDVDEYCDNDLDLSKGVLLDLLPQIELRRNMSEKYKTNLLSKSDAQIAEVVIKAEVEKAIGHEIERPSVNPGEFYYDPPSFIRFNSPILKKVLGIVSSKPFVVMDNGTTRMPKELSDLKVKFGNSVYRMGIGGLHSSEKTAFHVADDRFTVHDWDVTSYYPSIILNCKLCPKQLGEHFLVIYQALTDERVEAKKVDKVKADGLKITINGTFGKTGSPYSIMYEPKMMIQITVTGQLSLLMLIEMLESEGIQVVSGNTDGVVMKCPTNKNSLMRSVIRRWERITGFNMEEAEYAGLYSRDVNNYVAIKKNGEVKTKGCFSPASLSKNPENEICSLAMIEYLKHGTPFETTIRGCRDITKFLTLRSVSGGAAKNGVYLGKAIRWYHAKGETGVINAVKTGDKVPMTDGVKPLMTLDGVFPDDIDYDWYIRTCEKLFL